MKKNTLVIIMLCALGAGVCVFGALQIKSAGAQESENGLVSTKSLLNTSGASVFAAKFVKQVNILKGVKLDTDIFQDPSFRSLIDWSRPIPAEPAGRTNPFAPL